MTTTDDGLLHLTVTAEELFEPIGEDSVMDRLIATIYVNGWPMHLEAIRVERDAATAIWRAVQPDLDTFIDYATAINGERLQVADMFDGHYMLVATSFGD